MSRHLGSDLGFTEIMPISLETRSNPRFGQAEGLDIKSFSENRLVSSGV